MQQQARRIVSAFLVSWDSMILNEIIMYLAKEENILTGILKTSNSEETKAVLGAYFNSSDSVESVKSISFTRQDAKNISQGFLVTVSSHLCPQID